MEVEILLDLRWCAYEMGCFFSREEGQLEILPVKVAYILFLTAIFWHLGAICLFFGGFEGPENDGRCPPRSTPKNTKFF